MSENRIKAQMNILIELQETEAEIARREALVADAPNRVAALESRLAEARAGVEQQKAGLDDLAKTYRGLEADVQMNVSKQKGKEAKLGSVKTNKEYQALLKEIEELKELNSQIEDRMLAILDQLEAAETALKNQNETLQGKQRQMEAEMAAIDQQTAEAREALTRLRAQREEIAATLEPDFMARYQEVHRRIPGRKAVAAVINGVCQECHMNIPPQLFNELHRWDGIYFCPHCQRIIYWKKSDD